MIRRAIWLASGAILGILGYRRLGRMARSVLPRPLAPSSRPRLGTNLPNTHDLRERKPSDGRRPARSWRGTGAREFFRDVADGMADYMDRHSGRSGNTLVGQQVHVGLREVPGSDNLKDGR
ncbi:MAG TPA: hypothetical protein VN840_16730 [Streptosporangiaceae bacterium]|nr:hypothetical protein [Streptosporangiaceae bacterium]